MLKDRLNYKLLNLLILCAIAYLAIITNEYWLGFILRAFSIMVPFILAFAFAYALDPFVKYLERKGVRRSLAVAIVIIVVLVFCGGILAFTLPLLYDQFVAFAKSIMEFINDISMKFNLNLGGMELKITDIFNQIIEGFNGYDFFRWQGNQLHCQFVYRLSSWYLFLIRYEENSQSSKRTFKTN